MTAEQRLESLLNQITALPEESLAELVQVLVEMRAEHFGIYRPDDDEHTTLAAYIPQS